MQKKENEVSSDALAERYACNRGIEEFKRWYPNGHAPLTGVLRKLQELASTSADYDEYVEYAKWLFDNFPPTQETLVLNELTEKVIFWNGDIDIKSGIDGDHIIIGNGDLNIAGGVKLTECARIWAKNVKGQNITLYDCAGIWAEETIKAINIAAYDDAEIGVKTIDAVNIAAYGDAGILAEETIKAINIAAYGDARISAEETIDAVNIAAYDQSEISAKKINTQNIMDDTRWGIRGDINLIRPSSNQQNTTTAS
ncbi:hypothetical protein J3U75_06550 [Snodgrassella sp. B3088]|uniref:hypothetical protein n=1 Tax=Snodgrassella sp. B3088 TaxID=2818038 RepID=UPI00226AFB94|nr:hypothetical protein [Snodgrassella sp. B3088]MCX8749041.1 hypothetical protein [Snodgrassella sp. B3088]